jgi:hypothetical protein
MTDKTAIKKTRKPTTPNSQSKAAQIRKLAAQGKLTPKQIAEKLDAPLPYVYVVRSKMKAEARGLPAVAETKIPVLGGIQDIAVNPTQPYGAAALAPVQITMVEPPTFFERVKDKIRAWLS